MQTEWNFNYANYVQNVSLPPGRYKLECWGACGGAVDTSDWTDCAKGGYSKGEIVFKKELIYKFVSVNLVMRKFLKVQALLEVVLTVQALLAKLLLVALLILNTVVEQLI